MKLYRYFEQQTGEIAYKTWTWLRKGHLKKEIKLLQIATENTSVGYVETVMKWCTKEVQK